MDEHKTIGGLVKDALDRLVAKRKAQGVLPEAQSPEFWLGVVVVLLIVGVWLYFQFAR